MLLDDAYPGHFNPENISHSNRFGGRILDAGSGAGRDTRHFIENGFMVVSFDASDGMVRKCNEYPHAFCRKQSFSEISYNEEFDGIWACASLLHVHREHVKEAVSRLTNALKPGGVMFVSVKAGTKTNGTDDQGRYFEYYDEDTLGDLFGHENRLTFQEVWKSALKPSEANGGTGWINLVLRRVAKRTF